MNSGWHDYTANGVSTTYLRQGSGPDLLVLPAGGVSVQDYSSLIELLSQSYTVTAPELPGLGFADIPSTAWSFVEYGAYFSRFLNTLGMQSCTVVGHSFGGGVALELTRQTELVRKLILIDSAGTAFPGSVLRIVWKLSVVKTVHNLYRYGQYRRTLNQLYQLGKLLLCKSGQLRHLLGVIAVNIHFTTPRIAQSEIATEIIWAADDEIYPAKHARALAQKIPYTSVQLVSGTHDWVLYTPELLHSKLLSTRN